MNSIQDKNKMIAAVMICSIRVRNGRITGSRAIHIVNRTYDQTAYSKTNKLNTLGNRPKRKTLNRVHKGIVSILFENMNKLVLNNRKVDNLSRDNENQRK